jgi:hypothetical protein
MASTQQYSVFRNKDDTTVSTFAFILFLQTQHISTLKLGHHHQAYSAPV